MSITTLVFLLWLTVSAQCYAHQTNQLSVLENSAVERSKPPIKGINIYNVLKKFDICYLKCNGKRCECCQKIKILFINITVCGIAEIKSAGKAVDVALHVAGVKLTSMIVKLDQPTCNAVPTKIGPIDVCFTLTVDMFRTDTLEVCSEWVLSYEKIPSAVITFGCMDRNVTADSEYHTVGSLRIVNGRQAAKVVHHHMSTYAKDGGIFY